MNGFPLACLEPLDTSGENIYNSIEQLLRPSHPPEVVTVRPPRRVDKERMRQKMAKEYKLSAERLEELKQELTYLKTVREKEVADLIKEARSFGDLSENSEYDEAKNEQGKLYSRIAEVENILANYVVIEENTDDTDIVGMGCKITVKDVITGDEETYQVVGSQEADPMNGRISEESPFGKALLGKAIGEIAVVEAPAGNIEYEVVAIER